MQWKKRGGEGKKKEQDKVNASLWERNKWAVRYISFPILLNPHEDTRDNITLEALISAERHFEMPMCTSQPHIPFKLWRLNSLFFVQPKVMDRPRFSYCRSVMTMVVSIQALVALLFPPVFDGRPRSCSDDEKWKRCYNSITTARLFFSGSKSLLYPQHGVRGDHLFSAHENAQKSSRKVGVMPCCLCH